MATYILTTMGGEQARNNVAEATLGWQQMFVEVLLVALVFVFSIRLRAKNAKTTVRSKLMSKKLGLDDDVSCNEVMPIDRQIEAAGHNHEQIVTVWRRSPLVRFVQSSDVLETVARAYFQIARDAFVNEVIDWLADQPKHRRFASRFVDLAVETADIDLVEAVSSAISKHELSTHYVCEVVTNFFAHVGEEERLAKWFKEIRETGPQNRVTPRCFSLAVRGLLHVERPEAAVGYAKEMLTAGLSLSSYLNTEIFRSFCTVGRCAAGLDTALPEIIPSGHAAKLMFDHCFQANDVACAKRLEVILKDYKLEKDRNTFEVYLKHLVSQNDPCASRVLHEMHAAATPVTHTFCLNLLTRAATAKYIDFAEELVEFVKHHDGMTVTLYGALMKVYSFSRNLEKACDLYGQVKADGLEPDQLMLTCLMKFASEIDRQDLVTELMQYVPRPRRVSQWTMVLRKATQEKDVEKAFALLSQEDADGEKLDTSTGNSILDACIGVGSMKRAADIVEKMKMDGSADIVTYNTLLKAFAKSTNLAGAKAIFREIEVAGLQADVISYNILINIAVNSGNIDEAWGLVGRMQSANIRLDGFSISTMFKAAKRSHDRNTLERVLSLLDHAEVDFSNDEVLLICVLDASVKFGDKKRVSDLLEVQAKAGKSPSVHSYGVLIRASGFANDMRRCRELWHEMVEERRFTPSELALGCMTNALVQAGCTDEAFSLVKEWTARVQPGRVVFSILWRGLSDSNRSERSLEVLEVMRSTGVPITSDVYAQLLECFIRDGKSDAVDVLVKQMNAAGIEYDAGMITNLTKHFCVVGAFEECLKLLKASGRHNKKSCYRRAQTLAFDKLLEGYVNAQRYAEGAALVDAMDEYDVQPTRFTLASVVTLWGRSQRLDRAFKAVETMTKMYNILPNNLVRMCLLNACLANNDISSAFRVFDVIRATNSGPDCAAFEALIKGSSRLGWHKECVRLVEEACGLSDVKPNFSPRDLDMSVLDYVAANLRKAGLMASIGDPLFKRLRHLRVIV